MRNGLDAPEQTARDDIAKVAAHDVRHMLSRSGLHEIVELARSVADEAAPGTPEPPTRAGYAGALPAPERSADAPRFASPRRAGGQAGYPATPHGSR